MRPWWLAWAPLWCKSSGEPRGARPLYQVLFNLASIAIAIQCAELAMHAAGALGIGLPFRLLCATLAYFITNTVPIAIAIAMTEKRGLYTVWKECYFWALPYYLLGATMVCVLHWVNQNLGWEFSLLAMPVAWVVYRSYRLYIGRLETEKERVEQEKEHVDEMNALHLRTIETLALAIEAKDQTTRDHLRRVQHYAFEIGKEMGLSEADLNGLRAASLLHDIGKLAVPEHIITKPGKLTPQEFEKMKIHPVVGAEILEQVNFPYSVAPIVRAHHERWDGNGYPLGLTGEEIPLGARILAAVDCLDALASDRQYRRALPLDQAMDVVLEESGKSYDPRVVAILARRYRQLEEEAIRLNKSASKLSVDARIERGKAPATGFASPASQEEQRDFHSQIAAAGREAQYTLELVSELGSSLGMAEMLSVLSSRLTQLIPCDSIAVYERKDDLLEARICGRPGSHVVFVARDSFGRRALGLGGQAQPADSQRKSVGGTGLPQRSEEIQPAAFRVVGATGVAGQHRRSAHAVPRRSGRVRARSLADSIGNQLQNRSFVRECAEVSSSGSVGDYRLSDWPEQYAGVVRAPES